MIKQKLVMKDYSRYVVCSPRRYLTIVLTLLCFLWLPLNSLATTPDCTGTPASYSSSMETFGDNVQVYEAKKGSVFPITDNFLFGVYCVDTLTGEQYKPEVVHIDCHHLNNDDRQNCHLCNNPVDTAGELTYPLGAYITCTKSRGDFGVKHIICNPNNPDPATTTFHADGPC